MGGITRGAASICNTYFRGIKITGPFPWGTDGPSTRLTITIHAV